ncbi:hypothetical protein, partial [Enterobacter ludwigii]|uniref:hypothetical protein n=1 Tax=Enterobacter ludwigii TaxID=299767 RepID=UPI0023AABEF4
ACPKYHDLSFDFSTHHDLLLISGGPGTCRPSSTGTFYPPAVYKIVNNFETTNGSRIVAFRQ